MLQRAWEASCMYLHAVVQWRPPVDGGAISFFPKRATTPFRPAASDLQCLVMRAENVLNNINHFDQHKGSRITGASKTGENNYQYCQCQRWPGRITHLVHTGAHTRTHTDTHKHTHTHTRLYVYTIHKSQANIHAHVHVSPVPLCLRFELQATLLLWFK